MKVFSYTKSQRRGLVILLLLVITTQSVVLLFFSTGEVVHSYVFRDDVQRVIDSLKHKVKDSVYQFRPFNPNYISDYKGYTLGLTPAQIDRLRTYRAKGFFVNSKEDFQHVTQVPDSILERIVPYFKFPKWVTEKARKKSKTHIKTKRFQMQDINKATIQDLMAIRGIGSVLSERIVRYRNTLGGYALNDQLYEVYGLESEVVERLLSRYSVISLPKIDKVNINEISAKSLSELPYLNYRQALKIIAYRTQAESIDNWEALRSIPEIDSVTLSRLKIYLKLKP